MFEPEFFSEANVLYWRKYLWYFWNFMALPTVVWRPHRDSAPGELCPPCLPLVTSLRSRGHFRYGVERAKRFVNVHLHCIVSNMERIRKISSLTPPGKVSADTHASDLKFFKVLAFFRRVLVVSYLQIQQTKNLWVIEILIHYLFAVFKVSRPETFETETETRPETFETETRKNGSRDESRDRDQVSRLHHWLQVPKFLFQGSDGE